MYIVYLRTNLISGKQYKHKARISQPNRMVIQQFTKDGQFVAEYDSLKDAENHTGVAWQNISKVVANKKGYYSWWLLLEEKG